MIGPKGKNTRREVAHDESDMDYDDELPYAITNDKWRNECDASDELADMDFRLVDD